MPPPSLGDYHLERRLGCGRLGEAFVAKRQDSPAPFVVRRLPAFLTEDRAAVDRFLEELQPLRQQRHPNLMRLLDAGWSEDRCLLVTEYVEGISLADCLRADRGPMPAAVAVELAAQAGEGLAYAHSAAVPGPAPLGRIHGDLCPENLVFDDAGVVRILDFGLLRAARSVTALRLDARCSAVRYLAPEQLRDDAVTERSDVFSLGAILFSLATGRRPWEAVADPVELVYQLCQAGLCAVEEDLRDVPEPVRAAIRQATSLDPARRFASMNGLTACLDAYLKQAAPPPQEQLKQVVRHWAWTGRGEDPRPRGTSVIVAPELLTPA